MSQHSNLLIDLAIFANGRETKNTYFAALSAVRYSGLIDVDNLTNDEFTELVELVIETAETITN